MLISLPASATMTGRRRPRRGQNGSREQPFWSVAAIIVVLVVSYWYGGGDDDATAAQITGKCEPAHPSQSIQKSLPRVRELLPSRRLVLIPT
jgi:hypothetical protein